MKMIDFLIGLMNKFINWRIKSWKRFLQNKSTFLEKVLFGFMFMSDVYLFALLSELRKRRMI